MPTFILTCVDRDRVDDSAIDHLTVTGYPSQAAAVAAQVAKIVDLSAWRPLYLYDVEDKPELDFPYQEPNGSTLLTHNVESWFWYRNLYRHFIDAREFSDDIGIDELTQLVLRLPMDSQMALTRHANALLALDPESEINALVNELTFPTPPAITQEEDDTPKLWFRNHYECPTCAISWDDEWSCQCDDECPECGVSYSPVDSDDLTETE